MLLSARTRHAALHDDDPRLDTMRMEAECGNCLPFHVGGVYGYFVTNDAG